MGLTVRVVNSTIRKTQKPGDEYVAISEAGAWEALERLAKIHPRFAHYTLREACGLAPAPSSERIAKWLRAEERAGASVSETDLHPAPLWVFDLSVGSTMLGADPANSEVQTLTRTLFGKMESEHAAVGIGRYDEARLLYSSSMFGSSAAPMEERRTIHLGLDLFVEPVTPIHAPLDGTVHWLAENTAALPSSPLVILPHATPTKHNHNKTHQY